MVTMKEVEQMSPEQLFEENQEYAEWIATRLSNSQDIEDVTQLALIGLDIAAKRFDVTKNVKFITYAKYYIKKEIIRNHFEKNQLLKVSRTVLENVEKLNPLIEKVTDVNELAKLTNLNVKEVERALEYMAHRTYSMDVPVYEENDSMTFSETIASNEGDWDEQILIKDFISTLDEREKTILDMRFKGYSQYEIGDALNMSQMHASRLLKKIKAKYVEYIA